VLECAPHPHLIGIGSLIDIGSTYLTLYAIYEKLTLPLDDVEFLHCNISIANSKLNEKYCTYVEFAMMVLQASLP
jgi:hypothetical protein